MEEINTAVAPQLSGPEEPPAPTINLQPDLQARRVERQQQWLAGALTSPDPKRAVLGSSALELLEFVPEVLAAMREVAAAVKDPVERLARLAQGTQMCSNVYKLADKLA